MALVGVVMGSQSDTPVMQACLDALKELGIDHEVVVMSAHRAPERVREYGKTAGQRGVEVIIAGAGGAAHLPGVLASWTTIPVIGVPLATSDLKGVDALYSIVQMPPGVPVAAVGVQAARNAAYLAAAILSIKHEAIREAYRAFRERLARS